MTEYVVSLKMTADGKLVVTEVRKAEKSVKEFGDAADKAGEEAKGFGRDVKGAGRNARDGAKEISLLKRSLKELSPVIGGLGIVQAGRSIRNTTALYRGFDQALRVVTGTTRGATREIAFILDTTRALGLVNRDAIKSYIQLAAAAKGTAIEGEGVRDLFSAYLQSSVALQRTNAEIQRGFVALTQIISKSQVSMEEIRQQLSESLPGALLISARAMGMTAQTFQDAVARGEVMSDVFIPKLAAQLRKEIPGGAQSMLTSFNALANAIDDFSRALGDAGLFDLFSSGAETTADALDQLAARAEEIIRLGQIIAVLFGARVAGAFVNGAAKSVRAQLQVTAALRGTTAAATAAAVAGRAASKSLALLGGPAGAAVIATALAMDMLAAGTRRSRRALDEHADAARRAKERLEDLNDRVRQGEALTTSEDRARIRALNERIDRLKALIDLRNQSIERAKLELRLQERAGDRDGAIGSRRFIANLQAQAQNALAEIERLENAIRGVFPEENDNAQLIEGESRALKELRGEYEKLTSALDPALAAQNKFAEGAETLEQAFEAGLIPTHKDYRRLLDALRRNVLPSTAERIAEIRKELQFETRLLSLSNAAREAEIALRREQARAAKEGRTLTAAEAAEIRNLVIAHQTAAEAAEERRKIEERAAEEIADIWREARRSVQELAADQIFGALNGELDSVRDIADAFKRIWFRAFAEIAAAQIFSDIGFVPGGPFSGGAANDNRRPARVILDDSAGLGKALSGFGKQLNRLGERLGFAPNNGLGASSAAANRASGAGPGQTLAGGLGAAGRFAGQFAGRGLAAFSIADSVADLVGLGDRGSRYLRNTATGLALGGPIGAIIGGLLTKTPQASAGVSTSGVNNIYTRGRGDASTASTLGTALIEAVQRVALLGGGAVRGGQSLGVIGQRGDDFFFNPRRSIANARGGRTSRGAQYYDSADAALLAGLRNAMQEGVFEGLSDTVKTIANRSRATGVDQFLAELEFAETYDALAAMGRESSRFVDEIKSLNREFAQAITRARELGLSERELADARERTLANQRRDFNRETEIAILEFTDPVRAAFERQADEARQYLLDAAAVGADLDQARRRVRLEREALIEEFSRADSDALNGFRRSLESFIEDIRIGGRSSLSAYDLLPQQLQRFNDLVARAPTDEEARGQVLAAADDLRETAIDALASSQGRFQVETHIIAALERLAETRLTVGDPAAIAHEVGYVEMDPELAALMDDIGAEIAASNAAVVNLLSDIRDRLPANDPGARPRPSTNPFDPNFDPRFNPGFDYQRIVIAR